MAIEAILLGTAQDGGVPQAGCDCERCRAAWADPARRQWVVCLALVDRAAGRFWLLDATPDFREQLRLITDMAPGCKLAGIVLTHAHVGHYGGLIHLGREVMGEADLPVHVTSHMAEFLSSNAPWSQLVALGNIQLVRITPGQETRLSDSLWLTLLPVPHRNEFADTVALLVRGPNRRLLYCPDIDRWDLWDQDLAGLAGELDVALLDATFFSAVELPGRDLAEIPHPLVTETVARLRGTRCDVRLIHLNHSNPLLESGPEREWLEGQGMRVGSLGDRWIL